MAILKSVLVVGPTGAIGLALCQELIRHKSSFTRIAAFNNTSRPADAAKQRTLDDLAAGGMELVAGTYDDEHCFRGFDAVLMPLGNFANYLQPGVIDTAIAAGVRHFYPSEFGADLTVGENWTQRYYRDKVLTRMHLSKRAAGVEGLGWSFIQTGRLTEWATISYFGIDNATHSAVIYGSEEGRQSLINVPDAATYTVRTLLLPFDASDPASRQRSFRFHGESPSWKEIFAMLQRITGNEYQVTYKPVEEALKMSRQADELKDDKLAMNASHRVVQGSNWTLLPSPYDNNKFPDVHPKGVEEVLRARYTNPELKTWYGL